MVGPAWLALTISSSANNLRPLHFLVSPSLISLSLHSIPLSLMKNSNTTICSSQPKPEKLRMAERPVRSRRRSTHTRKVSISRDEEECTGKDDEFEKKIVALKKIVPGGETLAAENLFEETADYILSLQYKVEALRFLVTFVESSQNSKRKLGG